MANRTCRSRKRRGCLLLCAALFITGTLYLIASPDPETDVFHHSASESERASKYSNRHICDDTAWGPHRLSVIIPFRDRFDELLEFVPYMRNFLCRQHIRHQLIVVNQADLYRYISILLRHKSTT